MVILFLAWGAASAAGPDWRTDFTLPNGEAKDVQQLLEANNPDRAGFSSQIVIQDPGGVDNPEDRAALQQILDVAAAQEGISVTSPFDADGPSRSPRTARSPSPPSTSVTARSSELADLGTTIHDEGDSLDLPEGMVRSSTAATCSREFELPESEIYGVLAAVIILILAFGSVLAMGLPIGIALFGLGIASAVVTLLSNSHRRCPTSRRRWWR